MHGTELVKLVVNSAIPGFVITGACGGNGGGPFAGYRTLSYRTNGGCDCGYGQERARRSQVLHRFVRISAQVR